MASKLIITTKIAFAMSLTVNVDEIWRWSASKAYALHWFNGPVINDYYIDFNAR